MQVFISETGELVHDGCGGVIGRKQVASMQIILCKSCDRGVMGSPVKLLLQGAKVKVGVGTKGREVRCVQ